MLLMCGLLFLSGGAVGHQGVCRQTPDQQDLRPDRGEITSWQHGEDGALNSHLYFSLLLPPHSHARARTHTLAHSLTSLSSSSSSVPGYIHHRRETGPFADRPTSGPLVSWAQPQSLRLPSPLDSRSQRGESKTLQLYPPVVLPAVWIKVHQVAIMHTIKLMLFVYLLL